MTSFVNAFKYLFQGNTDGFAAGLVGAIPLLAVVLIVFGLTFFLGKLTIFKQDIHTKYARMVAFGIALIGLATQSVFNAILNWSGAFLNIAFILAIIFMFMMFLNYLRKNNYEMSSEMRKAYKDTLVAKKELKHVQHDFELDEKERKRVMRDLGDLSTKLDSMKKLSGSELQMIDKLADLLRKATTAASRNDNSAVHGYAQMLTKEIGTLITTMKHEDVDENKLDKILMDIDAALDRWGHHSDLEKDEEKHLNVIFHKISSHVASAGADVAKRMVTHLMKDDDKHLLQRLRAMREKLLQLSQLRDIIMKTAEELRSSSYRSKHMEAQAVRTAIFNLQFTEAHNHLDQLRSMVEREPQIVGRLKELDAQMFQLSSQLHEMQKELNQLLIGELAGVQKLLKDEKDEAKKKKKAYADMSDDIFGSAGRLARSVEKLIGSLKYIAVGKGTFFDQKGNPREVSQERDEIKSIIGLLQEEHHHLEELASKASLSDLDLKKELHHFKALLERLSHVAHSVVATLKKFGGAPDAMHAAELLETEIRRVRQTLDAEIAKTSNSGNAISLP